MRKLPAIIGALVLVPSVALAQKEVTSITKFEFLKVQSGSGVYTNFKGAPIFVTVTPINGKVAKSVDALMPKSARPTSIEGLDAMVGTGSAAFDDTVYLNNNPVGGLYTACDQGNSTLDDLSLTAAGNGKAWKIVTFGVHMVENDQVGKFLVRWRAWETFVTGNGSDVSAFEDEMFDAGFYLNRNLFAPGSGDYMVTVNISLTPIFIVPNQTCYLGQQFREPHVVGFPPQEDGEGDFTSTWGVFAGNGPQIGFSEDIFFYDFPPNGVYTETEIDNFGPEAAGHANFATDIKVASGQTYVRNPSTSQWVNGIHVSGNTGSLFENDQAYRVARAGPTAQASTPPARLYVQTFAPSTTLTSLRIDVDAKVNTTGLYMRVEMRNYDLFGLYVPVYDGPVNQTDTTVIGFVQDPSQYVEPIEEYMEARIAFYRNGFTLTWPWLASVDMVKWYCTID